MRSFVIVATVAFVIFLSGIWVLPLQEPDEGRYADIARSMIRTGDWVTPKLNGIRYFEKPPLFFWMEAVSMTLVRASETAARLPGALAAAFLAALTFDLARRHSPDACGTLCPLDACSA